MNAISTDSCLRMSRWFAAPCERVFEAMVEPALMRGWMLADRDALFDIDLCVGGEWTITSHAHGQPVTTTGRFVEIDRPRRLVYTAVLPKASALSDMVAIGLEAEAGGCLLTLTQSGTGIAREIAQRGDSDKTDREVAWSHAFDALAALLRGHCERPAPAAAFERIAARWPE